ncbi:MAG: hypothetical protein IJW18_06975 [Lachnospiraceae bacterium]|nr:hypothetical protein [Lachnospiraceae bacterium]
MANIGSLSCGGMKPAVLIRDDIMEKNTIYPPSFSIVSEAAVMARSSMMVRLGLTAVMGFEHAYISALLPVGLLLRMLSREKTMASRIGIPYMMANASGITVGLFRRLEHTKLVINAGLRLLQKFIRYCPSFALNRPSFISVALVLAPSGKPQNIPINST